ncbi:hypothetical protein M378DRAFT_863946 [Amanita muscaria Koide BX008]|uniref:F-box domain-containing protein n=1 Tax=Amanita muscaria (strain Koide BX008) TaxID=946122 RepID=A0A0C2SDT7_AMAMK|nr:hypothetical protein M378DRAFT_863946 [Amanita muscaria Koide BX008]
MSRVIDITRDKDVERSEEEKANLIRAELLIQEATLQLLDVRFEATGRKARLEKIRRLKEALAVQKRCPVELWERIFELCCDPDSLLDTEADETPKHPLFILMRVCSLWRKVVLDAPKLWRSIRAHNDERGIALAARWLSRAGSIPRSLALVSSGGPLVAFQQLIGQHPFRSLDIKSFSTTENIEVIDFSQIPVESLLPLERLLLNFNHNNTDRTLLASLSLATHSLPNLRRLYVGRGVKMPQFHIPDPFTRWNHLRDLQLYCPLPVSECLSILRHSTSVETCSMCVAGTPFSLPHQANWVARRITLPNLVSLTLNFEHNSDVGDFVDLLTLPNLNSLTLGGDCRTRPFSFTQSTIEQLVERSRIRGLEEMRIHVPISSLHIGSMLQLLPFLRNLIVSRESVLDLETAWSIGAGKLGPRLRELGIHKTIEDLEIDKLLDMFESRERTCWETEDVSRIRHVSFWRSGVDVTVVTRT